MVTLCVMVELRLTDARLKAVLVGGDPSKSVIGKGNGWFGFGGRDGGVARAGVGLTIMLEVLV
jgi:hypothetical protein